MDFHNFLKYKNVYSSKQENDIAGEFTRLSGKIAFNIKFNSINPTM